MHSLAEKFLQQLYSLFQEKRCAYCEQVYIPNKTTCTLYALCANCTAQLQRYKKSYCANCGKISPQENSTITMSSCVHCASQNIPWDKLAFYGLYENTLQGIIKDSKFSNNLIFTRSLAELIAPLLKEFPYFDFIVPMPLHTRRLQERGYNQCLEIVKYINEKYNYPYNAKALTKVRHTKAQSTLSQAQRKVNVQNAFEANKDVVKDKSIVLFDDVSTTGSTLFWASKALKQAGAKEVFVLYIAATKIDYS